MSTFNCSCGMTYPVHLAACPSCGTSLQDEIAKANAASERDRELAIEEERERSEMEIRRREAEMQQQQFELEHRRQQLELQEAEQRLRIQQQAADAERRANQAVEDAAEKERKIQENIDRAVAAGGTKCFQTLSSYFKAGIDVESKLTAAQRKRVEEQYNTSAMAKHYYQYK